MQLFSSLVDNIKCCSSAWQNEASIEPDHYHAYYVKNNRIVIYPKVPLLENKTQF